MNSNKRFLLWIISFGLILSACSPTAPGSTGNPSGGPMAWIDAPLPGTVFRPPNPCLVTAHGSDPQGITLFELSLAGGEVLQTNPGPGAGTSLGTTQFSWTPPNPGMYDLRVRAQNAAGVWSAYASTVVIYGGDEGTPTLAVTSSPVPSATSTPPPVGQGSIVRASASTDTVYYAMPSIIIVPCGETSVMIQMNASDSAGITAVVLFYRLKSQASGETTAYESVSMTPAGGNLYEVVLVPQNLFSSSTVSSFGASYLQYQAVIQDNAGDTSIRTQVFSDLTLLTCTR